MIMHDWNREKEDIILLIHPMLSSAKGMKTYVADIIGNRYRYLAPDLSAHGDAAEDTYKSALDEARQIHDYLVKNQIMKLKLGFGASLGGVILLQILKYDDIQFEHVFFEGTSFYTNEKLLEGILRFVFLKKHKKAVADPVLCVKRMSSMFGTQAAPLLAKHFIAMSEESIRNIVHDCAFVELTPLSYRLQKNCMFAYGDKDFDYKKARRMLHKTYPHAGMKVWRGYGHCERMTKDQEGYCRDIEDYIRG